MYICQRWVHVFRKCVSEAKGKKKCILGQSVKNELKNVKNELKKFKKSLRGVSDFFSFVKNELKNVKFELTPAWWNSSTLSHSSATNEGGKHKSFSLRWHPCYYENTTFPFTGQPIILAINY